MKDSTVQSALHSLSIAVLAIGISSSVSAQQMGPWLIEKSTFVSNACTAKHTEAGGMSYTRAPQGKYGSFWIEYPKKELEGENVPVVVETDSGTFSSLADGGFGVSLEIGEDLQTALERSKFIRVRHGSDIVFDRSLDGLFKAIPALRKCVAQRQ